MFDNSSTFEYQFSKISEKNFAEYYFGRLFLEDYFYFDHCFKNISGFY